MKSYPQHGDYFVPCCPFEKSYSTNLQSCTALLTLRLLAGSTKHTYAWKARQLCTIALCYSLQHTDQTLKKNCIYEFLKYIADLPLEIVASTFVRVVMYLWRMTTTKFSYLCITQAHVLTKVKTQIQIFLRVISAGLEIYLTKLKISESSAILNPYFLKIVFLD